MATRIRREGSHPRGYLPRGGAFPRAPVVILAAALSVGIGSIAGARMTDPDPGVPEDLRNAIVGLFEEGACVRTADAIAAIRESLMRLDHGDWAIAVHGAGDDACASVGFDATERTVVVIPAQAPPLREALQGIAEAALDRCLTKAELTEMVSSALKASGVPEWTVRSDGRWRR